MKRGLLTIAAAVACALGARAVPACPEARTVTQPDGSTVTIQLHGDEFFHYTATADGYTVELDDEGYYVYVTLADGATQRSGVAAHDQASRGEAELAFLSTITTGLVPDVAGAAKVAKAEANGDYAQTGLLTASTKSSYDYSNFRGLVILAQFNDLSFSRDDIDTVFTNMLSQKDYAGVPSTDGTSIDAYTGSVRDYYYSTSAGLFDATFDVVGPVTVDYSCKFMSGATYTVRIARAVLAAADSMVDYSDYDTDGDGYVDMFYIIYAGYGSNYTGNDEGYVWPHATSMSGYSLDGVTFRRYACSNEIYGWESTSSTTLEGIGTICHEFSHVLGLVDEYDTDGTGSGGTSVVPDTWSIMSGGNYLNYGRTPPSYSAFERYQAGFMTPTEITANGEYTLRSLDDYNEAYRINTTVDKEYYLLENRRRSGWNAYLPGSGMLVFRVDSTDTSVWSQNTINCNPDHQYYELVRAAYTGSDSAYDPFPGSGKVKKLTNSTDPSIQSWTGTDTPYELLLITESNAGVITLTVGQDETVKLVEDFEKIATFTGDASSIEGVFTTWDFTSCNVMSCTSSSGNGSKAVSFYKGGYLTSLDFKASTLEEVSFTAWNNNSLRNATVHLYVSTDYGSTWTEYYEEDCTAATTLKSSSTDVEFVYPIDITGEATMIKILVDGGLGSNYITIDDVTVVYSGDIDLTGVETVAAQTTNSQLGVATAGTTITIFPAGEEQILIYDASGALIDRLDGDQSAVSVTLPRHGFYILRQGNATRKIVI